MFLPCIALLAACRICLLLLRPTKKWTNTHDKRCSVAVFLGSGGHTSEALALVSALDFQRYNRRIYFITPDDSLSIQKAKELELRMSDKPNFRIMFIPRARRVKQSLLTTPFSAIFSLLGCIYHLTLVPLFNPKQPIYADLLILNGPGTCFLLCIAVFINKFLFLPAPVVIYVETFARVKALSLSGRMIRPLTDLFITQWPDKKLSCKYWLV